MSKAYSVHITTPGSITRPRIPVRRWNRHYVRMMWGLWRSVGTWGSQEGVNHTACRHYRLGPLVLHVYEVKP